MAGSTPLNGGVTPASPGEPTYSIRSIGLDNADTYDDPVAAQHGVPAEQLDRGVFGIQKQKAASPIYQCDPFQPPAKRQPVGRLLAKYQCF